MKTIEEMIAVMQAYADGKEIEYSSDNEIWSKAKNPFWDWDNYDYRIKPEGRCEYRPYYNSDEFAEDQKKHGPYIKLKSLPVTVLFLPSIVGLSFIVSQKYTSEGLLTEKYDEVFKKYVWQDGTPCGVMEGGEE